MVEEARGMIGSRGEGVQGKVGYMRGLGRRVEQRGAELRGGMLW